MKLEETGSSSCASEAHTEASSTLFKLMSGVEYPQIEADSEEENWSAPALLEDVTSDHHDSLAE